MTTKNIVDKTVSLQEQKLGQQLISLKHASELNTFI